MGHVLRPGEYFAGYQIVRKLGAGGMGAVYQARDRDLPRFVALKLLTVSDDGDPEHRIRFRREADAVARLEHPNIVTVYARGEDDHQLWISMTFVDGSDVSSALRYGAMHPARTVRIIGETAAALDHAHETGILHRDVKPANILLTQGRQERALLTDFGIAKTADESRQLTRKGEVLASVQYSAPERLMETGEVDHRADVYSLGCTLFHMLTGRLPYPGDNMAKIVYGHAYAPVPRPSDHIGALPRGFDEVIARALAKRPERRFQSCSHFAWAAAQTLRQTSPSDIRSTAPNTSAATRTGWNTPPRPMPVPTETAVRPPETRIMPTGSMSVPVEIVPPTTVPPSILPPPTPPPEFDSPRGDSNNRTRWIAVGLIALVLGFTLYLRAQWGGESTGGATISATSTGSPTPTTTLETTTATTVQTSESVTQTSGPTVTTDQPVVTVEIPDVRGSLFAKAKEQLEKLGFIVVAADRKDDSAKGTVVALDPASGTSHRVGTTITVYVSTGASTITMPDLSGLTVAQAEAALKQLGWKGTAQQSGTAVTDSTQGGKVVGQTPAPGSSIELDAAVTLQVGKLATSTSSTTPPSPTPGG